MDSRKPIIQWRNVWKSFDDNRVLKGVTLDVYSGETLIIIGRSGEGKSVLLKTLLGLVTPEDGEVYVEGRDILTDRKAMVKARGILGMVFQSSALFDSLTVAENLALPYWENTDIPAGRILDNIRQLLALVGMRDVEELLPSELSGGMRKRVGLARALADEPQIILYDEPTTGLDPIMADAINDLIVDTQRELNVTSIVVTHDLTTVRKVADRVAMLHDGEIIFVGTADELFASNDPYVRQFIEGRAEGPIKLLPTEGTLKGRLHD